MVRDIHWPQMSDEEIRKALKFEVERQVHYKTDEIVFDYYSVIDKSIAETKTRVILVAAKKDLIENYMSLIASAGFECGFVEVDTFSLLNCFYVNGPEVSQEKTVAVINVGMEVTNIDIIKGKIVGLTKDAFVAWSNLIDALPDDIELDFVNLTALKGIMGTDDIYELSMFITNALSNQIRRTIEFYESQGRDTVEEIFLSGKVAMSKNLDKYLKNILGLKITVWDPLANIKYDPKVFEKKKLKENSLMMALCAGLACHRSFDINLSPEHRVRKENKFVQLIKKNKKIFFAGTLFIFFLVGIWIILVSQIKLREDRKQKLLRENERLEAILKDIAAMKGGRKVLDEHMMVARSLFAERMIWSRKLYEISTSVPEGMWLTAINIKKSKEQGLFKTKLLGFGADRDKGATKGFEACALFIKGAVYVKKNEEMLSIINAFLNNLKKNRGFNHDFSSIQLNKSYMDTQDDKPIMKFSIECKFKCRTM